VALSFAFDSVTEALLDFVTGSVDANMLFDLPLSSAPRKVAGATTAEQGSPMGDFHDDILIPDEMALIHAAMVGRFAGPC
jgi:hypothetical protein